MPAGSVERAAAGGRVRISPHFMSLIKSPGDPLFRQCVPDELELKDSGDLLDDPLDEDAHSPVECIVHRYPDHCLFLVSNECATYCRFCTRKRKFRNGHKPDKDELDQGFAYLKAHPEIRDVLISGGDPLLLDDSEIEYILNGVRQVKSVEIIRIGTRIPSMLPQRITRRLCRILKKYHPLYMNCHFNHPDEIDDETASALNRLADAGIPLGSQTVLLKGVNDDPAVMRELMQKLLRCRVRPYYMLQMDLIQGTSHFRTPLKKGVELIDSLRGWTSGLAVPHFIVDLPRGGGKVELVPDYIRKKDGSEILFRNYRGEIFSYPEIED